MCIAVVTDSTELRGNGVVNTFRATRGCLQDAGPPMDMRHVFRFSWGDTTRQFLGNLHPVRQPRLDGIAHSSLAC